MSIAEIHRPADLAAAAELLSRTDEHIVPLAVSPRMPIEPYAGADAVVDLSRLKLSYITEDDAGIHIGALTPLQDIAQSELLSGIANGIVCEAAELAAHLGLRNIATLGGALGSIDGPQELRLALNALGASGVYPPNTPVYKAQILGEVIVKKQPGRIGCALERVARTPRDESIVAVAAVISRERVRVLVGPQPVHGFDSPGEHEPSDFGAISLALSKKYDPPSDFRASAEYRRAMAGVLVQRALEKAWQRAGR